MGLGLCLASLAGCVHQRDFHHPRERITRGTAYAEHARVRVDAGLLAPETETLVINTGVTVAAVRRRLDFTINLAHGGLGVLSAQSKFTLVDRRWYALGGRVGVGYIDPSALWLLPEPLREELGDIAVLSVPVELWQSVPLTRWFSFNLGAGYRFATLRGELDVGALLAESNIASRQFSLTPVLNFYIASRVALLAGVELPLSSQTVAETDVEIEIEPGLSAGLRSVEWLERRLADRLQAQLALETRFGYNTHMRVAVNLGALRPLDVLIISPSLEFYWRFR